MSEISTQFGGDARELSKAVTDAYAVVLGPIDLQDYANLAVYAANAAGDDVASILVESAPEATGYPWVTVDEVLDGPLAASASAYKSLGTRALKFVRVSAKCAATKTATVNFWLCASRYGR